MRYASQVIQDREVKASGEEARSSEAQPKRQTRTTRRKK